MVTSYELTSKILNNLFRFELSPTAKLVFLYLIGCYNPENKYVYPKQKTIEKIIKVGKNSVKRAIAKLEESNLITKSRIHSNYYEINLDIIYEKLGFGTSKVPKLDLESPKKGPLYITNKEKIKKQHFINSEKEIERTKEIIKSAKESASTIVDYNDWSREHAIEHLRNGIPRSMFKYSTIAKELMQKFSITMDEINS